jgi:hypothetical protein
MGICYLPNDAHGPYMIPDWSEIRVDVYTAYTWVGRIPHRYSLYYQVL